MGQLVIEIPQNVSLKFHVRNPEFAEEIMDFVKSAKGRTMKLDLPEEVKNADASEALGIWADRQESAEEIAREIRDKNRRVT